MGATNAGSEPGAVLRAGDLIAQVVDYAIIALDRSGVVGSWNARGRSG